MEKECLFEKDYFKKLSNLAVENNTIPNELYSEHDAKVGLRNKDGSGVLIGLTEISDVRAYRVNENGERVPQHGQLFYRGIEIKDLVKGYQKEKRHGFEEVCYLLLFGQLPNKDELNEFKMLLADNRELPEGFIEDMILKAPSKDVMNKLGRNILTAYSYDSNPDDTSVENVLRQCIQLIAQVPSMIAYAYHAKEHFYKNNSLYIHRPLKELSSAENLLHMVRADNGYSELEAELLDLNLILHAEHGGGNNSTFTTHVVTSSDTDTYSAISAAVGSLKGPKHGGANKKVMKMIDDIKANVKDWSNEKAVEDYLVKIIRKEAFDKTGLIYGMGHAVYTLSDPRAVLMKDKAHELAEEKNMQLEFGLYNTIEKLAPQVFAEVKKDTKMITPNVDFYSGFVYKMLNIPVALYTPIFAMARMPGWAAHRIEELVSGGRIIRPAYKNVIPQTEYVALEKR
ncbi:citrate synthase [Desulfitispora alkaliphila]|uniref:citrate/2-methylcitrate synthase n=1 Tax=Desulfitispora alkaliphila TaxID=622674 RepID=UPI003D24DECE